MDEYGIGSPVKQAQYLLQLALSSNGKANRQIKMETYISQLKRTTPLFTYYFKMFTDKMNFDTEESGEFDLMAHWIDYNNTSRLMASQVQIISRIRTYLGAMDKEIQDAFGTTADQLAILISTSTESCQRKIDEITAKLMEFRSSETRLAAEEWETRAKELDHIFETCPELNFAEYESKFGKASAETIWSKMVANPNSNAITPTPSDFLEVSRSPIIEIEEGKLALIPIMQQFPATVYGMVDYFLSTEHKERYSTVKAKVLERNTTIIFQRILPEEGRIFENVFLQPDSTFEVDVIVVTRDEVVICECKSKEIRAPFRDFDKALPRLRQDFSDVREAYVQTLRASKMLATDGMVTVFDNKGNAVGSFNSKDKKFIKVCCTYDDYGNLGTSLSMLNQLDLSNFWCVNELDLDSFIDAIEFRGWGWDKFVEYVVERSQLYGKVISEDELAIAGWFISKESLGALIDVDADNIVVDIDEADIFDSIFRARQFGEQVTYNRSVKFRSSSEIYESPETMREYQLTKQIKSLFG